MSGSRDTYVVGSEGHPTVSHQDTSFADGSVQSADHLNVVDQNQDQSTSLTDQTETHLQRLDANGATFVRALNVDQTVDPSNSHLHRTGSGTYDLRPNGVWPLSGSANESLQLDQTYTDDQQTPPRTADTTTLTLDLRYARL
jgi:hypothetical protein